MQDIQPGNPRQNVYVERSNRTVRYEWLSQYLWDDLVQVRLFATQGMYKCNHHRPHMSLAGFTSKQQLTIAEELYICLPHKGEITSETYTLSPDLTTPI